MRFRNLGIHGKQLGGSDITRWQQINMILNIDVYIYSVYIYIYTIIIVVITTVMTVVITIVIIPVKIVVIIVMIIVIKIVVAHQHDPKYRCIYVHPRHRNLPLAFFGCIYTKKDRLFCWHFFCEVLWKESCRKSGMIEKKVSSWKPFVQLVAIQCWYTHY